MIESRGLKTSERVRIWGTGFVLSGARFKKESLLQCCCYSAATAKLAVWLAAVSEVSKETPRVRKGRNRPSS